MHALGRVRSPALHEIGVHPLGEKRNERRQEFRQLDQHVIQRLIGGQLVAVARVPRSPEAAAVAADVPVRQIVDEVGRLPADLGRIEFAQTSRLAVATSDCRLERIQRSISGRSATGTSGVCGIELVEPRVVDEEGVRVPQRNQHLAADFVGRLADDFAGRRALAGFARSGLRAFAA